MLISFPNSTPAVGPVDNVTIVTAPTPPNDNFDRSMYVWVPSVGGPDDPISSDDGINTLLSFCASVGVNVIYLDMFNYLGGSNWSVPHAQQYQKVIHYCHASGIRVYALCGDFGWGHDQRWVMANIVKNLVRYQNMTAGSAYRDCKFDGLILDAEYWDVPGYTEVEPIGMCDLMKAMRNALRLPIGFSAGWWQTGPDNCLSYSYNGVTQYEGYHLMDAADFVTVGAFYHTGDVQVTRFQPWFDYAKVAGRNIGLYCVSLTDPGFGDASYWTGVPDAKYFMEVGHATVSNAFTGAPNTNAVFLGQAIEQYSTYVLMG